MNQINSNILIQMKEFVNCCEEYHALTNKYKQKTEKIQIANASLAAPTINNGRMNTERSKRFIGDSGVRSKNQYPEEQQNRIGNLEETPDEIDIFRTSITNYSKNQYPKVINLRKAKDNNSDNIQISETYIYESCDYRSNYSKDKHQKDLSIIASKESSLHNQSSASKADNQNLKSKMLRQDLKDLLNSSLMNSQDEEKFIKPTENRNSRSVFRPSASSKSKIYEKYKTLMSKIQK